MIDSINTGSLIDSAEIACLDLGPQPNAQGARLYLTLTSLCVHCFPVVSTPACCVFHGNSLCRLCLSRACLAQAQSAEEKP